MPRGDKTGPEGKGPLTGRGFGLCNDDIVESTDDHRVGLGLGPCGRGMANRRGFGNGRYGRNRRNRYERRE